MTGVIEVAKLDSRFSEHYLNIVGNAGPAYCGGNQSWWKDKVITGDDMGHDQRLKNDRYYRLWKIGCGTVAMSDAELYLTLCNSGYSLSVPGVFDADFRQTGVCGIDAYRDYIEQMYGTKYEVTGGFVNRRAGLYPWKMAGGFRDFLTANGRSGKRVKWAGYGRVFGRIRKKKILDEIERMLRENIPVVFSYHSFAGDNIILYDSIREAADNVSGKENPAGTDSHYMTMVGLYKFLRGQSGQYEYILQVVSWGRIYYINYGQYAKKLDYFSNILSVSG